MFIDTISNTFIVINNKQFFLFILGANGYNAKLEKIYRALWQNLFDTRQRLWPEHHNARYPKLMT